MTKRAMLPLISISLYSYNSTSTGFNSTGCFFRASSYARRGKFLERWRFQFRSDVRPLRLAVGVVSVRRKTETKPCRIALPAPGVELHQPRGPSQQQNKN